MFCKHLSKHDFTLIRKHYVHNYDISFVRHCISDQPNSQRLGSVGVMIQNNYLSPYIIYAAKITFRLQKCTDFMFDL